MNDFKEISVMKFWCQKVLPLVYEDSISYYEVLGKVVKKLNELIENNEKLPSYIKELIESYITSGAIGEVVRDILVDFMLNVKNPPNGLTPAVGNGSADDTQAIQGCIDYAYANGGKCVYFPSGVYLTQALTVKDKTSLFGFDRYTTKIVLKGGATNPLINGSAENISISGLTLDGNMDIQVNNIDLINLQVESAILSNLVLTDGYNLVKIDIGRDLQISDVVFDYAVVKHIELSGGGICSASNLYMYDISTLKGECLAKLNVSNSMFSNVFAFGDTPLGFLINGNNNVIDSSIKNALVQFTDNGTNNSITVTGISEQKKFTGDVSLKFRNSTMNGENSTDILNKKEFNVNEFKIDTVTPIDYRSPTPLNEYFKTIPFKHGNENYDVLVKGTKDIITVVDGVKDELELEVIARENADTVLDNKIIAEKTARENAINSEKGIRENADVVLDGKISAEKTARENADIVLDGKITTEKTDRENADIEIHGLIDGLAFGDIYANVKQYGAIGNGIADDTLAFQRALDTKKKVYIPSGKYKITDTLKLYEQSSIFGNFVGANNFSRGLTLLDFQPTTKKDLFVMISEPSDGYYVYGVEIGNFTITSTQGRYIFNLARMSNLYIHDISYQGGFDFSICVDGWIDSLVERCSFQGVVNHHIDVVLPYLITTTTTFRNCYFSYADYCYNVVQGATNSLVFDTCIFESMNYIGVSETENNIRLDNLYIENMPRNGVGSLFKVGLTGDAVNFVPNIFAINGGFIQGNLTSFTNTQLIESGYITDVSVNNVAVENLDTLFKFGVGTSRINCSNVSTYKVRCLCNGADINKVTVIGCNMPFTLMDDLHDTVFLGNIDISPIRSVVGSPVGTTIPVKLGEFIRDSSTDDMYVATNYGAVDWKKVNYTPPVIRESTGSPVGVLTPLRLGEEVLELVSLNWYKSVGYTSADWKMITNV